MRFLGIIGLFVFMNIFKIFEVALLTINKRRFLNIDDIVQDHVLNKIFEKELQIVISMKLLHIISIISVFYYFSNLYLTNFKYNFIGYIVIFIFCILVLILGILLPEEIGKKKSYFIIKNFGKIIYFFYTLTSPFSNFAKIFNSALIIVFNINQEVFDDDINEHEIRKMVDEAKDHGSIDSSDVTMINNVFEFDNRTAGEIATHRIDIVALNINSSTKEIVENIITEQCSRIPIYDENIDDIVGILHIKDLVKYFLDRENLIGINIPLKEIMHEARHVPEIIKTDDLFELMQKERIYMVIVVDEYGGTVGILTMEDLTEEIMGNIADEYDEHEQPSIEKINENTYLLNGAAELYDIEDVLEIHLPTGGDFTTIGGFLVAQLGHVPSDGAKYEVEYNGVLFKITKVLDKRIVSVIAYVNNIQI